MFSLYVLALLREFRWTLAALAAAVLIATLLYWVTPHDFLGGRRPDLLMALYGGWMALLAQPLVNPPQTWYLTLLCAVYPLIGAIVIGEGVIRLALLMMSRRRGEKEWARVMVATFRDHVVLCGLGHLGFKVLEQLVAAGVEVVTLERRKQSRFVNKAKELDVPVLIRDMKEDQALVDAGIKYAKAIIIATNDPMANLEVALDARRMNPDIRVIMRMFDEQIADKLTDAMDVDVAFSSSTLAAPIVAAMALQKNTPEAKVLSSVVIGGMTHVTIEASARNGDGMVGKTISAIESEHGVHVLAHGKATGALRTSPSGTEVVVADDRVVLHTPAEQMGKMMRSQALGVK